MPRIAKVNTYTRIINASLALFNEEGERNISTNHIAAHLGISPGNLYYHFRNKDEIIVQLFKRYSEALLVYLNEAVLPSNVEDSINYMAGIYDVMWEYRFLFSDVNTLLCPQCRIIGRTQYLYPSQSFPAVGQPADPAQRPEHHQRRPNRHERPCRQYVDGNEILVRLRQLPARPRQVDRRFQSTGHQPHTQPVAPLPPAGTPCRIRPKNRQQPLIFPYKGRLKTWL